jgi:RHS repeat-associated protein
LCYASEEEFCGTAAKQELSYDAWGRFEICYAGSYGPGGSCLIPGCRGYTGHEYLPWFGLINMNARLYNPALGRFLSPDPYVQIPDFSQNFNRSSYCLNNPLVYVDEDGEFIFSFLLPGIGTVIDAALWGAVIGGAGYTASIAFSNGGFLLTGIGANLGSRWNRSDFRSGYSRHWK